MRPSNRIATRSGDVVFANSTCYGDDLMNQLAQGAAALKEGAIVVTMTDPVPSPAFEVLEEVRTRQAVFFSLPDRLNREGHQASMQHVHPLACMCFVVGTFFEGLEEGIAKQSWRFQPLDRPPKVLERNYCRKRRTWRAC